MDETSIRERAVMAKIARRLMPLLVIMFLIAFIDRQNVGFAKLQMVHALGMTETSYGLGASLFFIGYLLFEVPSTLALHRFGARLWLARIMMTWGVITVLLGFTHSTGVFYVFRFLLGVAEAGFYPGVIYYLTLWFPQSHRTRVLGLFTLGSALANMLGSLAGGLLLSLDGRLGLAGWQWVFVATGLPAIAVALVAWRYLPESVERATFLADDEKRVALAALKREASPEAVSESPWRALVDPRVLMFALAYMLMSTSLYGVTYWLPTLLKSNGVPSSLNGLLNMIPWAIAALLLLWLPARLKRERIVLKAMAAVAGVGGGLRAQSRAARPASALRRARAGRRVHSAAVSVLLVAAAALFLRRARRGEHRRDQLDRQSRRIFRAEPDAVRRQGGGQRRRADARACRVPGGARRGHARRRVDGRPAGGGRHGGLTNAG